MTLSARSTAAALVLGLTFAVAAPATAVLAAEPNESGCEQSGGKPKKCPTEGTECKEDEVKKGKGKGKGQDKKDDVSVAVKKDNPGKGQDKKKKDDEDPVKCEEVVVTTPTTHGHAAGRTVVVTRFATVDAGAGGTAGTGSDSTMLLVGGGLAALGAAYGVRRATRSGK